MTVEMVANWCRGVLGVAAADSLWYERLGETYCSIDDNAKAIDAFNSALSLGDTSAECHKWLAVSLAMVGKYSEACLSMDRALEMFEAQELPNKSTLTDIYTYLSELHMKLNQPQSAVECVQKAINLAPDDHEALSRLLRLYILNHDDGRATKLLTKLARGADANDGPGQFGNVIDNIIEVWDSSEVFLGCINAVSDNKELFGRLLQELDPAIDRAAKDVLRPTGRTAPIQGRRNILLRRRQNNAGQFRHRLLEQVS